MRILLIEPEPTDRFMIKRVLQKNHDVFDFGQIDEALTFISKNEIDVVAIKDYMNEKSDAAHALSVLKNGTSKKFMAVAIMEYASDAQREYLTRVGFQEVISKPLDVLRFSEFLTGPDIQPPL